MEYEILELNSYSINKLRKELDNYTRSGFHIEFMNDRLMVLATESERIPNKDHNKDNNKDNKVLSLKTQSDSVHKNESTLDGVMNRLKLLADTHVETSSFNLVATLSYLDSVNRITVSNRNQLTSFCEFNVAGSDLFILCDRLYQSSIVASDYLVGALKSIAAEATGCFDRDSIVTLNSDLNKLNESISEISIKVGGDGSDRIDFKLFKNMTSDLQYNLLRQLIDLRFDIIEIATEYL